MFNLSQGYFVIWWFRNFYGYQVGIKILFLIRCDNELIYNIQNWGDVLFDYKMDGQREGNKIVNFEYYYCEYGKLLLVIFY